MAIAHLYTILGAVDRIHSRIGYTGGRLGLKDVFQHVPGLLLATVEPDTLPPGASGAMQRVAGCVQIAVDATLPRAEQRVAVAHEIGHALLHAGHLGARPLPGDLADRELQAERFAEELLLPLWALEGFEGAHQGRARVRRVAEHFEVPERLAEWRLATLPLLAAAYGRAKAAA